MARGHLILTLSQLLVGDDRRCAPSLRQSGNRRTSGIASNAVRDFDRSASRRAAHADQRGSLVERRQHHERKEEPDEMNGKPNGFARPIREKFAARAHRIWEQEGVPLGREIEHWQRAERELAAATSRFQERGTPPKPAQPPRGRKSSMVDERAFRIFQ